MKNRTFKIVGNGPWFGRTFYVHVEFRVQDVVRLSPDEDIPELRGAELAYDLNHGMKLGGVHTDLLAFDANEATAFAYYVDNNWSY